MRKIFNSVKADGTKLANPKYNDVSYIAAKQYIMAEFQSEDSWYITVYLRPYKGDRTLVTAFVPQLEAFSYLNYETEYKASLQLSIETLKVLNPSDSNPPMFVSNEKDITGENKYGIFGCVHKILDVKISPKLLDQDFKEFKYLEEAINNIVVFVNNFINDLTSSLKSDTAIWKKKVDKNKLRKVINLGEKNGFYGSFIGNTRYIQDEKLKNFVEMHKYALVCNKQTYTFGDHILNEDLLDNAFMIILLENFDKAFADSGWLILLELEYERGWRGKVNLGKLIEGISIIMNNTHKTAWAKVSESAYRAMPVASDIWFYTNYYHHGVMLHRFIADNDRTDYGATGTSYVVTEPNYIKSKYPLDADLFWIDRSFTNNISSIINKGLTIILEFEAYHHLWMKKTGLSILVEIGKFTINPFKYTVNKIFRLK